MPGASRSSATGPMRVRTSRATGSPTAAHILRTWRLRPSWIVSSSALLPAWRPASRARAGAVDAVVELDACSQTREGSGSRVPLDLGEVGLLDAVARVREELREVTVVRQEQEPFGVDVEPADGEDAAVAGNELEHRRPPLRIVVPWSPRLSAC